MRFCEAGVGPPHNLLELPELAEETRVAVVDTLSTFIHLRMNIALNVPNTVGKSTSTGTCDLLLLKTPLGKFSLVREKDAACHDVNEPELRLNSSKTLLRLGPIRLCLHDLYAEQVISIALESSVTIGGDFVLPVSLSDRGTNVVGVKTAISSDVVEPDDATILNVVRTNIIPSLWAGQIRASVVLRHNWQSLVLHDPNVVLILMRVQGDLLLLATSRVHMAVRMEVTALCVPVTERDTTSVCDIGRYVLHALRIQGCLKLGRHEAIAVTGIDQADEVDTEHGHVKGDGDNDQAKQTGEKVLEPQSRRDRPCISEQDPELEKCQAADPCDGEESNPLHTSCSS